MFSCKGAKVGKIKREIINCKILHFLLFAFQLSYTTVGMRDMTTIHDLRKLFIFQTVKIRYEVLNENDFYIMETYHVCIKPPSSKVSLYFRRFKGMVK